MIPITISKTIIAVGGDLLICDTISYEGDLWLVPEWLSPNNEEWQTPKRMIRVTNLVQEDTSESYKFDLVLNEPLPKSVLDGETVDNWKVLEEPGYKFVVQKLN